MKHLFYALCVGVAVFLGIQMGAHRHQQLLQVKRTHPIREEKFFTVMLYASQEAFLAKKTLRSVLEQDYEAFRIVLIDDGLSPLMKEDLQNFIQENRQEDKIEWVHHEKVLGPVASLYQEIDRLSGTDLVLSLGETSWLSHPGVLARFNSVYQDDTIWLVLSDWFLYPSYEKQIPKAPFIQDGDVGVCCYAGLFQQIPLSDLMNKDTFSLSKTAYLEPLLQLGKEHAGWIDETLLIAHRHPSQVEGQTPKVSLLRPPLKTFPVKRETLKQADVFIFSYDRPLQLFACLESMEKYVSGVDRLSVLYRCSHESFFQAYQKVQEAFPNVQFILQGVKNRKDFKPLLMKHVFEAPSPYILFGVDDDVVKDFVDLSFCIDLLDSSNAYGFYLRFGHHIDFSYQMKTPQAIPPSTHLKQDVYAWAFDTGSYDWNFPNSLDMALYRKKDLQKVFGELTFRNPNSLEFEWDKQRPSQEKIGLYFSNSKKVNLPLNIVTETGNPHMDFLSLEELLSLFEQGFKIDIEPLHKIENHSPHFDYKPTFVPR